jgi:hypothetical protein
MQTKIPTQRQEKLWVKALRRLLKLQIVKHVAFTLGLKGFDRVHVQIGRFMGYDENGQAKYRLETPQVQYNARVNAGAAVQASVMSGTTLGGVSSPAVPKYIALSTTSLTPAMGDTTLSGETAVAGVARAVGTIQNYVAPASLDAAASYDIYKLFTLTGGGLTINSSALLDAASTGNMFAEANLASAATLATNDTLAITWTVNI